MTFRALLSMLWLLAGCYQTDLTFLHSDAGNHSTGPGVDANEPTIPHAYVDAGTDAVALIDGSLPPDSEPDAYVPPIPVPDAGDGVTFGWSDGHQVEAGGDHTCAVKNDGRLDCWGSNFYGQTGHDPNTGELCNGPNGAILCVKSPTSVVGPNGEDDWLSVSAGHTHSCAITRDGRLFCWGSNTFGELGNGSQSDYATPNSVPAQVVGTFAFSAVAAGENHTCAITNGALLCWGRAADGELGSAGSPDLCNGDPCALTPQPLDDHNDWTSLVAGGQTTCGIRAGEIYCWGWSALNQLGLGCEAYPCASPVTRVGTDNDWLRVNTWASRTCAIKYDGSLWCWGSNEWFHGTIEAPAPIALPESVIDVATGEDHTCAVTTSHDLYCWGNDSYGQIGDGPGASSQCDGFDCTDGPVRVGGNFASVSVGYFFTCALKQSGSLVCWGSNSHHQVGAQSSNQCETGSASPEACAMQPIAVDFN